MMTTDPSSITTVTEEEEDSDESDTTETSYHSKASDAVSSVLYSSECNTDDKLTPCLGNISISNKQKTSPNSKKRPREFDNKNYHNEEIDTTAPPFPYGCNPSPMYKNKKKVGLTQAKMRQKRHFHASSLTKYVLRKNLGSGTQSFLPKQEEENFGIDDPNNYLYTDFSDTSSVPLCDIRDYDLDSENDEDCHSELNEDHRPFLPNMSSQSWFQAKCFDQYWSHYNFVMEWYREHVHAVNMLSSQYAWEMLYPGTWQQPQNQSPTSQRKKNRYGSKSKRAKRRARNRRLSKARQRASGSEATSDKITNQTSAGQCSDTEGSDLEMEITEEMMDFLTTSFKYRMDRDNDKKEGNLNSESKTKDSEKGASGSAFVFLLGPSEQPGVRRTAEMKTLYGAGSPMIHGMETALQMTFDNIVDRHQPKLWPNVPLKIVFA